MTKELDALNSSLKDEATEIRFALQRGEKIPKDRLLKFLTNSAKVVSAEKRRAEPKLQILKESDVDFF